jgi:Fe2+ transport system protein FeoA
MAVDYLSCPFCGFEFARQDTLCRHGCPLAQACHLVRCPSCQYEFPERPKRQSWLGRLFQRAEPTGRPGNGVMTVRQLDPGASAQVVCVGGHPDRQNRLAVFGLVPGATIRLIQRKPEHVIKIGETELALEDAIAEDIVVSPAPEAAVAG